MLSYSKWVSLLIRTTANPAPVTVPVSVPAALDAEHDKNEMKG